MHDLELFCKKCLISDSFFVGGGSWAPDSCPECGGTACIIFGEMTMYQQAIARKKFDEMWKAKWNNKG